jgi:hypothetical protein
MLGQSIGCLLPRINTGLLLAWLQEYLFIDLFNTILQDTRMPEESIHDFARDLVQALQYGI